MKILIMVMKGRASVSSASGFYLRTIVSPCAQVNLIAHNKHNGIARNSAKFRPTFWRLCFNFLITFNLNLMARNKCN